MTEKQKKKTLERKENIKDRKHAIKRKTKWKKTEKDN